MGIYSEMWKLLHSLAEFAIGSPQNNLWQNLSLEAPRAIHCICVQNQFETNLYTIYKLHKI